MVYQSLKKLISKYPWFFDKSESSNFFRSQYVTNRQFQDLYQSLFTVIQSFKLNKRCLIWKDQTAPYDYIINFIANFPNMKSVSCYKNDTLIYSEHYTYEENVSSFIYFYDSSDETISMEDVFEETDEEPTDDEPEEEIPIIPTDTFKIIVETYDEYQIIKGFPENDTRQGNEFDHDYSLDRIGQIDGIPRKEYIETEDYANTEPPYNDKLTEDDYHYMNRILNYNLRFHNTPRPVLEIWKMYGIFSDMINREEYLFKMFDENHHLNKETGLYDPDWTPKAWEHKDRLCELTPNLGQFFFVSANTLLPVQNQSVRFEFKYINSLADDLTGDYNVSIFLNDDDEPLVSNFTGSQYVVDSTVLADDVPNNFVFVAYHGDVEFAREELTVNVRGCSTADWYVSPNGDDSNDGKTNQTPFQTINKALTMVNGEENLIVLMSGTHTINQILSVPYSCTILGCGSPVVNNTDGLKFFNVLQNKELTLQNLTLKYDTNQSIVSNASYHNNNMNRNGLYVVIREGIKIATSLTVNTNKSSYVIGESIVITGSLLDGEAVGLSGKSIKIYVNNDLVDTVTTLNSGSFSKNVTAEVSGNVTVRAVFEGDDDYYSSADAVTIVVNKKPVTITFASNKASYVLGETITLSGTLKQGTTNIGSADIEIYDGETLVDTVQTLGDGTFSKTVNASAVASKSFHAEYHGSSIYDEATSSNVNVTITKRTATITLLSSSASVTTGESYTISGALQYNGAGISNAPIKLYQGNTLLQTINTLSDGTFSKTITGSTQGTFTYHAEYDGDNTYNNATSSNITVIVSDKPAPDSITLVAEKPIMSKGENNKITATVLDSDGNPCVGETVSFSVVDGEDLGTAVTESVGEAFVYYLGKDADYLYIKGICGSQENTVQIRDVFYYNTQTVNNNHYQVTTGSASVTYSSNGITVKGITNTDTLVKNTVLTLPENYVAELTITRLGSTPYGGFCFDDCLLDLTSSYCYIFKLSNTSLGHTDLSPIRAGDTVKIEMQNGTMKIYINNTLKHTRTVDNTGVFQYRTYNNRSLTAKNLIIHEL